MVAASGPELVIASVDESDVNDVLDTLDGRASVLALDWLEVDSLNVELDEEAELELDELEELLLDELDWLHGPAETSGFPEWKPPGV